MLVIPFMHDKKLHMSQGQQPYIIVVAETTVPLKALSSTDRS